MQNRELKLQAVAGIFSSILNTYSRQMASIKGCWTAVLCHYGSGIQKLSVWLSCNGLFDLLPVRPQ